MGKNVKGRLSELLTGVEEVSPQLFEGLLVETGASAAYLRRLLRQTPVRLHPLVEGVRQDSFENLCRTLSGLSDVYGVESKRCRDCVLESKRHSQILLARNPADAWRRQVLLHLNTWLENPVIYPVWSQLQKKNAASS
ncbi:MAG: hypothetical protein NTW74_14545 [Acidobacteria bacterium]|nr:hypothetical protein [Acidobacteriota bacterium]